MTTGIAETTANAWIDGLTLYAKAHTGDPGAAGTANASAETTRKAMTFAAANGGSATQTGTVSWATWSAGSETITHISYWDNLTVGAFIGSFQLTAPKPMTNGDTLDLSGCTFAITPIAA
jgi:hypothetical protein